jgi:hypothetical protein
MYQVTRSKKQIASLLTLAAVMIHGHSAWARLGDNLTTVASTVTELNGREQQISHLQSGAQRHDFLTADGKIRIEVSPTQRVCQVKVAGHKPSQSLQVLLNANHYAEFMANADERDYSVSTSHTLSHFHQVRVTPNLIIELSRQMLFQRVSITLKNADCTYLTKASP